MTIGAISSSATLSLMAFTVAAGRIAPIDVIAEPERLRRLDLSAFAVSAPAQAPSG